MRHLSRLLLLLLVALASLQAFFVWRGVRPQTEPVLQALRDQLAREAA
jgi:HAMP domain-containing protein